MHPNEKAILRRATREAATFFARFISSHVDGRKRREFVVCLEQLLTSRLGHHWYPDSPDRGQAYRCIRLNPSNNKEPLIETAVIVAGLTYNDIQLPLELTVWIDPDKVTYRFGEDDGSHCTLISFDRQLAPNKTMATAPLRACSHKLEPRMHAMRCREGHKFCFMTQPGIGVLPSSILPPRFIFHRLFPVILFPPNVDLVAP
ncbi:protein BTG1-like [Daphnia carinata]|uniref:protein BTG1-like n=1 Tax=Daphnia carinata TaxID=120202 RepID=UPI002580EA07|nr:protein BTG1-like [Daphnia carinata]